VPKIEDWDLRRRMDEGGVSPIAESPWVMDVSRRFEEVVILSMGFIAYDI
jgi:hypothetical protein